MRSCASLAVLTLALSAFAGDANQIARFASVNDHIYRGGQPGQKGVEHLVKLGIRTVIDLREGDHSADEERFVVAAGMRYVHIPMAGLSAPADDQIARVLALLDDSAAGPVFIHCKRGADRTGTVVACYRIRHDHWDNQKALAEARKNGMSFLERGMQNYILHYSVAPPAPQAALPASQ